MESHSAKCLGGSKLTEVQGKDAITIGVGRCVIGGL